MVWLTLLLLFFAFRRGWVLAPMILFVLPFVSGALELSLLDFGVDVAGFVPDPIDGFTAHIVSVGGLLVLASSERRL